MKKRLLSGCLVLISVMVAVLLSAGSHAFAAGYDANANLKTGDVYNAHFEIVTAQTITTNGVVAPKITRVEKMNMLLTVQNIDQDHNATIQCKSTALTPPEPQNADVLGVMNQWFVGKTFYAKVSSRGKVLELTGLDALADQFVDGGTASLAEKQAFKMSLQQGWADHIKVLFATLDGYFPQKSVQVGDTWDDDTANIKMSVPLTWKFVSDKDGILTVEGKGKMSVPNSQTDTSIGATAAKENGEVDVEETLHMHKDHLFVQTGTVTAHGKETTEMQIEGQTVKRLITVERKRTFEITKQ